MQDGQNEGETPQTTALVVLGQVRTLGPAARPRHLAGFVTQLLACTGNVPAYRVRRRAEPDVALASYGGGGTGARVPRFDRAL